MFQKQKLYAIATDKKPFPLQQWGAWWFDTSDGIYSDREPLSIGHHLYLTSNDNIKAEDWYLLYSHGMRKRPTNERVGAGWNLHQHTSSIIDKLAMLTPSEDKKKIVATTNANLWSHYDLKMASTLNQPGIIAKIPKHLINYFAENQGKVDEVMVEYEDIHSAKMPKNFMDYIETGGGMPIIQGSETIVAGKLKLNDNGEIIWKRIDEKTYTRNEIKDIIAEWKGNRVFDDWFDKNYPQ
jgi:hypothetical protein